jgi:hypothetical protein
MVNALMEDTCEPVRLFQEMKVKIDELEIRNFKSIKHLKINCKRINIFIGEPNTGKSNILEAIGLLSHIWHGDIKRFVRFEVMTDLFYDRVLDEPFIIGFDQKSLRVKFKDGRFYGYYEITNRTTKEIQTHSLFNYDYYGGASPNQHKDLKKFKFYRFIKRTEFKNQKSEFLQPPDGDNLLAVIMTRKRLRRTLNDLFGNFGYRPLFRPQEGKIEVSKEFEDIIFSLPYSLASETFQRLVFYLAAIHSNKDSILTFEEPEAHAFPYYTKYLAERIALDRNNNQFFITTHNPYFLVSILEKTPKKEVTIFVTSLENYQTKVKPLTEKQKEEILDMGLDVFFNVERFLG